MPSSHTHRIATSIMSVFYHHIVFSHRPVYLLYVLDITDKIYHVDVLLYLCIVAGYGTNTLTGMTKTSLDPHGHLRQPGNIERNIVRPLRGRIIDRAVKSSNIGRGYQLSQLYQWV